MGTTASSLAEHLDKVAQVCVIDGVTFEARIADVRQVFGRMDFLVIPTAGTGKAWISSDRVSIDGKKGGK